MTGPGRVRSVCAPALQVFVLLTALLEVARVRRAADGIVRQPHDRAEGVGVVRVELQDGGGVEVVVDVGDGSGGNGSGSLSPGEPS